MVEGKEKEEKKGGRGSRGLSMPNSACEACRPFAGRDFVEILKISRGDAGKEGGRRGSKVRAEEHHVDEEIQKREKKDEPWKSSP